ncbi:G-protein-signaling modulator 2 [Stylophora pistillata]|uniref:G-protein-signaling modulator 2 n=1 Tax=Stylophora pistillata TaxID=50429 RepID=A0A2B4S9U0_STYPI|nr:G-protein-signaling modulator 2 [Stylophora pistillata]
MSYTAGILEAVRISLDVAIILLKTDRALKATEFCNKCVSLLQNFDSGTHLEISEDIINVYCAISGYTNEARYNATKLLNKLHRAGILTIQLGDKYHEQNRFEEAKQAFESALTIMKMTGHSREEAVAHGRLGVVTNNLNEKQKAIEHHKKALGIAIEMGDRQGEGASYRNLGSVYYTLGEYQTAREYHDEALAIATEIGDKEKEVISNRNLGILFRTLGINQTAKEYYEKALAIMIEIEDRKIECAIYLSLGTTHLELGKNRSAKECFDKALNLCKETGDKTIEAGASVGLATFFAFVKEKEKAKEHCEKALVITRKCGDRAIEAEVYLSVGNLNFQNLDEYDKGEDYLQKARSISIEIGDKMTEFQSLYCIANLKRSQSKIEEAKQYLCQSIEIHEHMRCLLKGNEEFEISLLEKHGRFPIEMLTKLLCKTGKFRDALYVEELGRARSLTESMAKNFSLKSTSQLIQRHDKVEDINVIPEEVYNVEVIFKKSAVPLGALPTENCENRPLGDYLMTSDGEESKEPEIIIVPDRFSYRVPFNALRDESTGKYLSDNYRIRIIPSLTTLRLIQECPADYHSQTGALVVGDPKVGSVLCKGEIRNFSRLKFARKEAEMVGQLLGVAPLLGAYATKKAVLQAIPSVSVIHIAAHGDVERGEISLSP